MAAKCCVLIQNGSVVARQCTTGAACPDGWTTFEVASCADCPPYPTGAEPEDVVHEPFDRGKVREFLEWLDDAERLPGVVEYLKKHSLWQALGGRRR